MSQRIPMPRRPCEEGSKETSLARSRMKNIIAKCFDSYAAVIISDSYIFMHHVKIYVVSLALHTAETDIGGIKHIENRTRF